MKEILAVESAKTCSDFNAITDHLAPFARRWSATGREFAIVIPPYSYAFYALRESKPFFAHAMGGQLLSNQLLARRCLVEALNGLENVSIYAFDNAEWITGDLANYRDAGHLANDEIRKYMLNAINNGAHRLTTDNIEQYITTLRENILTYEAYNSALENN